jgi:hypothetical protein
MVCLNALLSMGDGKLPDGVSAFFWLEHLLPRFKQLIVVRHKSGGTKMASR